MDEAETLKSLRDAFVDYKRSTGVWYESTLYLDSYVNYAEANHPGTKLPTIESVKGYISNLGTPCARYTAACYIREFGRYLAVRGYEAYVLPRKLYPPVETIPPFLFSEEELALFFTAVDNIEPVKAYRGRELILPAVFRTLCCCGLRCKEVRMLHRSEVNTEGRYIDIIRSKGAKDRRVFISQELADYLRDYDEAISRIFPDREFFFPGYREGKCMSSGMISENFNRFWKAAFPDFVRVDNRPRAYDLRHHYAWANINKWARAGQDINAMMLYLMKSMGHKSVKQTLYYFHLVHDFYPDLVKLTADMVSVVPEVEDDD